jgi:hypothetical protein
VARAGEEGVQVGVVEGAVAVAVEVADGAGVADVFAEGEAALPPSLRPTTRSTGTKPFPEWFSTVKLGGLGNSSVQDIDRERRELLVTPT